MLVIGTTLPASSQYDGVRKRLSGFIESLEKQLEEITAAQYAADISDSGRTNRSMALHLAV